ncbi:hypothetical protein DSO57_1010869 [Entomophthora muscae]|uniref:Uncharacterized protein n=1 Tax=Entomophthora muscae TaxID=34485 RepID=A0ACC2TTF9_9FUNG|nr:hypothetical protein DSO57_1010869 [Entomophthora muscae]
MASKGLKNAAWSVSRGSASEATKILNQGTPRRLQSLFKWHWATELILQFYKTTPNHGNQHGAQEIQRFTVCRYRYKRDTPMSTLQKHLRAKHCFSVRRPLSQEALVLAMNDVSAINLEESIVDWLYRERLPVSAIQCQSFSNIFTRIDPTLTIPTTRCVEALFAHKFQAELTSEKDTLASRSCLAPLRTPLGSIYSYLARPSTSSQ